jgi:superfamily II DNA or RNA helicase
MDFFLEAEIIAPPKPAVAPRAAIKMRDYQLRGVTAVLDSFKENQSALVVMPTGCGKTILFAEIIRRFHPGKSIVFAHREELIFQAHAKIAHVTGFAVGIEMADLYADINTLPAHRPDVIVSTIQTQCAGKNGGRMLRFDPHAYALLIIDEGHHCFPAGTMVGDARIESIRSGDVVPAFDHATQSTVAGIVNRVYRSKPETLVCIFFGDGSRLVCTDNHPIWSETRGRYVPAVSLDASDVVCKDASYEENQSRSPQKMYRMREAIHLDVRKENLLTTMRDAPAHHASHAGCGFAVRNMWLRCRLLWRGWANICKEKSGILFRELRKRVHGNHIVTHDGAHKSEVRIRPDETQEPDAQASVSRKGQQDVERTHVSCARRERRADRASEDSCRCAEHGNRTPRIDPACARSFSGDAKLLQSGHSRPIVEAGNRSGRQYPQAEAVAVFRQTQNRRVEFLGVDRVEVLESGRDGTFGGLCPDGCVYNIEVEGFHNYYANGILVHNCTSPTYRKILDYYKQNPRIKILGVTATPDRADEEALGQVYDDIAFDYEILDAIRDGWLVPIEQQMVEVAGLDFSACKTTAGDLNGADLAEVMEYEKNLHAIADPTIQIAGTRRTLVFAASVAHAERLCEIFNRHRDGCAEWICGKTDKDDRRETLANFAAGRTQFVVNVGCLTEGFDDPGVEVIAMARPTKSRSLYAQMAGRATRPLPGVVDGHERDQPDQRTAAIAASAKPSCLIIDFVGNSGRHKLMTTADILGGNVSDEAAERAAKEVREAGKAVRMADALEKAETDIKAETEARKAAEEKRRERLKAKATYTTRHVNPFDVFGLTPQKTRPFDRGRQLSEKQAAILLKMGLDPAEMEYGHAKQILDAQFARWAKKLCTFKQAATLKKHGFGTDVSMSEASDIIDRIAKSGWKLRGDSTPPTAPAPVPVPVATEPADSIPMDFPGEGGTTW